MTTLSSATLEARALRDLRMDIEDFHAAYCAALDLGRLAEWPDFFTDDALYRITSRENADAGLPAGLVYAQGKGMLHDRAFAIENTQMFAPRYLLHHVSNVRIVGVDGDRIVAQANYLLLQTLVDGPTTIQQAGRYDDVLVRQGGRLLLRERQCIYDTIVVANDLVYPV